MVLSYLNANVYIVIRRRRQHLSQRFINAELNNYKAETTDAVRREIGQILYTTELILVLYTSTSACLKI